MGRDSKHNYRGRSIYHVTLAKDLSCPSFSAISGSPSNPLVSRTPIGEIIERQILNFPNFCQSLQILQYVIMPDHIHFAMFARDFLPRAIGSYIGIREKPAVHDFELCSQGRLLILAPMSALPPGRETFLYLNSIAESVSIAPVKFDLLSVNTKGY